MSKHLREDEMINSVLCEDLKINILRRLSMKVLLRCRSVCKSWKALIASSYFINAHLNFNRNNSPQILIRTCRLLSLPKPDNVSEDCVEAADSETDGDKSEEILSSNHDDDDESEEIHDTEDESENEADVIETYLSYYYGYGNGNSKIFDLHNKFERPGSGGPKRANDGTFGTVGSCNGLICLGGKDVPNLVLWNPLINKYVYTPDPIHVENRHDTLTLGFGYDIGRNDYKLIRIICSLKVKPNVEIYRLSTRIWEDITHLGPPTCYVYNKSAYLNGAAHWMMTNIDLTQGRIILFDMQSEVFREMSFSSSLKNSWKFYYRSKYKLFTAQASLCLIQTIVTSRKKYDIWLMKEYGVAESWIKQYSIDDMKYNVKPLGFLEDGDLMLEGDDNDDELISYNPQSKEFRVLFSPTTTSPKFYHFYVAHYVPSLVLNDQHVHFSDTGRCILGLNVEYINENLQI